jgi:CheY-like chemotaxis protein
MEIVDNKNSGSSLPTSPSAATAGAQNGGANGGAGGGGRRSLDLNGVSSPTARKHAINTTNNKHTCSTTPRSDNSIAPLTVTTNIRTSTASGGNTTPGGTGSYSPHSRSEAEHTLSESGTGSPLRRSIGSSSSLLQAAPMKRISSGSSLATADGGSGLLGSSALLDNSSRKLLIAEDNAINMKVALGILRRLGFTNVVTAPDGVAAVEAVAAAGGPAAFDAILMDLHMPRKGGIEAVQDILRAWPNQKTKIVAVTADAFEETRDSCVANGFTYWLAKPFRVEEFARVMGQEL